MSLNKFSLQGRVLQTKPSLAEIEENRARALAVARRNRERNAARELKTSGLLPRYPGSQFGGWAGESYSASDGFTPPRQKTVEDKFQEFLANNRKEAIALKQTF